MDDDDEDDDDDKTKLLGSEDLSDSNTNSRTSSLFITNPMATANGNCSLVTVDLSGTSVEAEGGVSQGRGQEREDEEMFIEEPGVTVTPTTKKKRHKYLSAILSTLKNILLDLRLFLW